MPLSPQQSSVEYFEVHRKHLATAWRNDLPVVATPILLWWTELVAMAMMADDLGDHQMTVGAGHDRVKHLAPTGHGQVVAVRAEVAEATERMVVFNVDAQDRKGRLYEGVHTRAVVDRQQMLNTLKARSLD